MLGVALLAVAALAGCGGGDGGSGGGTITDSGPAPITLIKNGGIAAQKLTFKVTDPTALAQLAPLIRRAGLEDLGTTPQTGCADCFIYTIVYDGKSYTRDESAMPDGFAALVAALQRLDAASNS